LYKKFDGEIPGNEDRKEAISYGNEIKEFLLRIAKEKEEAGRMIFPALDRLAKLQGVCERCEDSKQKESLVSLHKELEARVKQEAPQALNLTKHKQKLRDQILNSKMTRAHTPERVALILTKEITMAFLDRGAMQNSKVGAMVENLKRNTDLWDILKKDEQLQYMIEQYQLMKPLSNESMLLDFYVKPWSNFSLGVLELEQRGPGEQQAILDNLKKKASNAKENLQRSLTEADVLFRKTEDTINQRRAPTALSEIVRCELSGLEEKIKFVDSCFKGGVEGLKRSQEYVRTNLATPDDFLKTAQGIYIVPFNEYDLRNPPSSAGVERLRKEYDLLVKRDPENAENWKKLASLTEEYVVAFEKYGEIFKDAYSKDAVSQKYYPSMDYTMNASQKEALRILRQANEKALGEVQALSFTPSEFIGVQKMHKEQYLQMLKFRQRLLSELENPSTYEKPS
ncbi:MAG: hypothetical protein ACE5GN_01440, partial [Waddliaceae bacterium]